MSAEELVPGDVVFLEAGSRVPADGRVLDASNFAVMEAALTGESAAAVKEAALVLQSDVTLADRHNMVYAGSMATTGQCTVAVTATGDHNEIGKINRLVQTVKAGKTPLLVQIEQFGKWLSGCVLGVAVLTLLLAALARSHPLGERSVLGCFG